MFTHTTISRALVTVHDTFVFTRTDKAKSSFPIDRNTCRAIGSAVMSLLNEGYEEMRIVDARFSEESEK